jgi:RNA polymerase subunit RPABC4/transcription elongation factor Spt4
MPTNWRVYKNNTVAARLDRGELPGFFTKKIVVGPNEGAIVLREGEPTRLLTATSYQAANGLDQLKSAFGLGADVSVFFVDLAPIPLSVFIGQSKVSSNTANTTGGQSVAVSNRTDGRYQSSGKENHQVSSHGIGGSTDAEGFGNLNAPGRSKFTLSGSATTIAGQAAAVSVRAGGRLQSFGNHDLVVASHGLGWSSVDDSSNNISAAAETQVNESSMSLVALSADKEIVQAACHVNLRVIDSAIDNLAGLLRGKQALATWDLEALLRNEWFAKVLVPEIALHKASDLRGNRALLAAIESQTREALGSTLGSCGFTIENFTLAWGLTDQERAEIARRRAEREDQALDFAKNRKLAQMGREQEIEKNRLANLQELKMASARGDHELRDLLLAGDLNRGMMVKNNQVDVALVDARIRDMTLEVERKENVARLEKRRSEEELRLDIEERQFRQSNAARLADMEAKDKEMWSMVKMQIEMATQNYERQMAVRRHESEENYRKMQAEIEDKFQQRKLKLEEARDRMGMMERLASQGLSGGQADASVLKTMLEQSTEQEYATTSDEMVRARAAAKAAGNNLETFRLAQADERAHQVNMTHLSAQMMAAARQPGMVPGAIPAMAPVHQVMMHPVAPQAPMALPGGQPQQLAHAQPAGGIACAGCGMGLQPQWKACPGCGQPARPALPRCHGCGGEVQPNWKACPACGTGLSSGPKACRACGNQVQPNWKACPDCGTPQ